MKKAVYPGTFDPITNGHLDVIRRGSKLFEELVVAVGHDVTKDHLFTIEERMEMIKKHTSDFSNVRVDNYDGMTVDYVRSQGTRVILRGIRTVSDFDVELQMALTNRTYVSDIETVFVVSSPEYSFLSSRLIKESVQLGGDVSAFVPLDIAERLSQKYRNAKNS